MSIVLSYTIGSGVRIGTRGPVLGTGATGRVGGTYTAAGHMTGIGITAMHGITTTTGALSGQDTRSDVAIMSYIRPFVVTNMQPFIRSVRSAVVTPALLTLVR